MNVEGSAAQGHNGGFMNSNNLMYEAFHRVDAKSMQWE